MLPDPPHHGRHYQGTPRIAGHADRSPHPGYRLHRHIDDEVQVAPVPGPHHRGYRIRIVLRHTARQDHLVGQQRIRQHCQFHRHRDCDRMYHRNLPRRVRRRICDGPECVGARRREARTAGDAYPRIFHLHPGLRGFRLRDPHSAEPSTLQESRDHPGVPDQADQAENVHSVPDSLQGIRLRRLCGAPHGVSAQACFPGKAGG